MVQTRFTVKKKKTQGQKSLRYDLAVYKTSEILKVPRALMRASHQADQRATSHRSALDFRFSVYSVFRGVCLARRSEATPTCIKTSTRHSANSFFVIVIHHRNPCIELHTVHR